MKNISKYCLALVIAALSPNLASAKPQAPLMNAQECQTKAQAHYKQKVTEVEMASIKGDLNALEAGHARESLQARLHRENESCRRISRRSGALTRAL